MVSILTLIKCMILLTLFLCCQIQATTFDDDINEMNDGDFDEFLPSEQERFYHQQYRRASLRYHPHVLYKKASLKPILSQNGKLIFTKRNLN